MARLLRKAVGAIAVYATALQAMLSGVVAVAHVNPDPFSIICTSNKSDNSGRMTQPDSHDCGVCVLTCGGG